MSYHNLLLEKRKGIGIITLNNPENLNVFNPTMINDLTNALTELEKDRKTKVVIITGKDKAFSAGGDIKTLIKLNQKTAKEFTTRIQNICFKIEKMSKPVIAAVNGYALGAGNEVVMACDLVVASNTAKFGQPEVKIGIMPGAGATQRLPLLVGRKKAKELIFTGEMIDAEEAKRIGLVNVVTGPEKLMEETMNLANKIMENSLNAIKYGKMLINKSVYPTAYKEEVEYFSKLFGTQDQKKGMKAFLEKRKPKFD